MEDTIGVGIFLSHTTFPVAIGKGPPSHPASAKERPTSILPPLPSYLPSLLMRGGFSLEGGVFLFAAHGGCGIAVE